MTNALDAIILIEDGEGTPAEVVAAYQVLIDEDIVKHLQGTYGREAARLIEEGLCTPPKGVR